MPPNCFESLMIWWPSALNRCLHIIMLEAFKFYILKFGKKFAMINKSRYVPLNFTIVCLSLCSNILTCLESKQNEFFYLFSDFMKCWSNIVSLVLASFEMTHERRVSIPNGNLEIIDVYIKDEYTNSFKSLYSRSHFFLKNGIIFS